ncbi:hypothetical protein A9487_24740 [Bacillus cereus]|nr:hypothetical protein A9487_24740 [Bacillus cereus]
MLTGFLRSTKQSNVVRTRTEEELSCAPNGRDIEFDFIRIFEDHLLLMVLVQTFFEDIKK